MMRLPRFRYRAPRTVAEAAKILAAEGPDAMLLAGGTDLLPNMKRRQQVPKTLVATREIDELRAVENGSGLRIGAGLTLSEIAADSHGFTMVADSMGEFNVGVVPEPSILLILAVASLAILAKRKPAMS